MILQLNHLMISTWICFLFLSTTVLGQNSKLDQPISESPEELVKLLVGVDLSVVGKKQKRDKSLASRAASALIAAGDSSVPALERSMSSTDPIQRLNTALVLTRIGTPLTVPLRIRAARDKAADVRALTVRRLPVQSNREAYETAWNLLSDPESKVRNEAITAFSYRHNPPRIAMRFGNIKKNVVAKKISEALVDESTRYAAASVLGDLGSNVAAEPLLAAMKDERYLVRCTVMEALGKLNDRQLTVEMARFTKDTEECVREMTCNQLGMLNDMRATPALVEALEDPKLPVRYAAATSLGKIGDLRATSSLVLLLDDPAPEVVVAAARSLGEIGDTQVVDDLIKTLRHDDKRSEAAATAIGQLNSPQAIAPLGHYLERNLKSKSAANALAIIRHPDAVKELARIAMTRDSIVARRAFGKVVGGGGFSAEPPQRVAEWWNRIKKDYQPLSKNHTSAEATGEGN